MKWSLCVAGWLLALPVMAQPPGLTEYRGVCDASAAVALNDKEFIVGDDESRTLTVFRLGDARGAPIEIPKAISPSKESEIEGATIIGDRVVWISSHGRNKDGVKKTERYMLFSSHRLNADGSWVVDFSRSHVGLIAAIEAMNEDYRLVIDSIGTKDPDADLAPKLGGFNIEGITVDRDGKSALIGLRNPPVENRAFLFRLENVEDLIAGPPETKARLGQKPILLDLQGRTIRDIAWSPAHNAHLIIGGPIDDDDVEKRKVGYGIYLWSGEAPTLVASFGDVNFESLRFRPEAIVPLKERRDGAIVWSKKVMLISDDGTRRTGPAGTDCKKLKTSDEKSFRTLVRQID